MKYFKTKATGANLLSNAWIFLEGTKMERFCDRQKKDLTLKKKKNHKPCVCFEEAKAKQHTCKVDFLKELF